MVVMHKVTRLNMGEVKEVIKGEKHLSSTKRGEQSRKNTNWWVDDESMHFKETVKSYARDKCTVRQLGKKSR